MKIGFLFAGQGAQVPGMGKDLYEKYDEVKEVYSKASEILGYDIANLTFNSSEEELSQTKNTQPAILVMSLGILKILEKNNIKAEMAAGLSLGEYLALVAGNAMTYEDAIKIVQKRANFMQEYVPEGKWAMAAVLGLEDEKVEEACKAVKSGFVVPANYNCVGQVAISGDEEGVNQATENLKALGAKRVVPLKTSGPFHTEKLNEASKHLREELDKIEIKLPDIEVIKNIDAKPYKQGDDIKDILANHVTHPVKFSETVDYMLKSGVDTFVEIGPGKTLSGFVKKASREVQTYNINNVESLESFLNYKGEN